MPSGPSSKIHHLVDDRALDEAVSGQSVEAGEVHRLAELDLDPAEPPHLASRRVDDVGADHRHGDHRHPAGQRHPGQPCLALEEAAVGRTGAFGIHAEQLAFTENALGQFITKARQLQRPSNVEMKVAKFGGTSLASAEQIKKICAIITDDPQRRLVVVSAPGKRSADDTKVTDLLIEAARVRLTGQDGTAEIERVIERYRSIAEALDLPNDSLKPIRQDFLRRLDLDTADEGLYMDTMKAGGEDNSARLVAGYLRSTGVEAHYVDPGEGGIWCVATGGGNHGRCDSPGVAASR